MNKSIKFLAISLLCAFSTTHAAGETSYLTQAQQITIGYLTLASTHAKQIGIGIASGFATRASLEASGRLLEKAGERLPIKFSSEYAQAVLASKSTALALSQGGNLLVAQHTPGLKDAGSPDIVSSIERAAGNFIGDALFNSLYGKITK